ncbi:MAG: amino acid ABC transporter substrate-binding protein, partial [Hyphomicrobium sp.]
MRLPFLILAVSVFAQAAGAKTLDEVKARGELRCGVNTGLAGFAAPDDAGQWRGIDADFCRAVAAAIFGNPANVKFVP